MEIFIAKADKSVTVDYDNLPEVSKEYIINYGLRQVLNDAAASVAGDDADVVAKTLALVDKRLARIIAGTVNIRESTGRVVDPIRAEAIDIALAMVRGEWKKVGKKPDAKIMLAQAKQKVDTNEAFMRIAKGNVEKRNADIAALAAMGDVGEMVDSEGLDAAA